MLSMTSFRELKGHSFKTKPVAKPKCRVPEEIRHDRERKAFDRSHFPVCRSCQYNGPTGLCKYPTKKAMVGSCLLFFCLCWPCCLIPFALESCVEEREVCGNCNKFIR
mmetsp:Transcript_17223/g.25522  ORF Transcript_17223/g.25522 Transcript_17223/m.25522 type:complete len:108 (+) Transcript_17223:86-409(+)